MDCLRSKRLTVRMFNTNGIRMDSDLLRALERARTKTLYVSLQAPDAASWAKLTGQPSCKYDEIVAMMEGHADTLRALGIVVSFVLHEDTHEHLQRGVKWCQRHGWSVNIVDLNNYRYSADFVAGLAEIRAKLKELKQAQPEVYYGFQNLAPLLDISDCGRGSSRGRDGGRIAHCQVCLAPWYAALLRPNGDVYTCCALGGRQHCLGNVYETSFWDVWDSPRAKAMKEEAIRVFIALRPDHPERNRFFSKMCNGDCPIQTGLFANGELVATIRARADLDRLGAG